MTTRELCAPARQRRSLAPSSTRAARPRRCWAGSWWVFVIPPFVGIYLALAAGNPGAPAADVAPAIGVAPAAAVAPAVDVTPDGATRRQRPLRDKDMQAFAAGIEDAWAGRAVDISALPASLAERGQAVYVAFRSGGKIRYDLWRYPKDGDAPSTMWSVLHAALEDGRERLGGDVSAIDRIEIALTHSYRHYAYTEPQQRRLLLDQDLNGAPRHAGVRGLLVEHGPKRAARSPTWFIAQNRRVAKEIELIRNSWKLDKEAFATARFTTFEADQVLVRLDARPIDATVMFRGNRIVDSEAVTPASTDLLVRGMATWMLNNVHDDGRLTYEYYPSPDKENPSNNMIRQWMATTALIRWASDRGDRAVFELAGRNIAYNLRQYFHYERKGNVVVVDDESPVPADALGVIEFRGKTKLGGVALAGLAMWLHPDRQQWRREIDSLKRMVDHLWNKDGSFKSFYKGSTAEFQNFYPGEALLWWATMYGETKDPELLRKYKLSFAYYRRWHLDPSNRNPAFVPWHIQAHFAMWQALGADEAELKRKLATFCFEMASWLIDTMEQWQPDEVAHDDERGRFYAPSRRYGVPHASSTGVYLEGLIDAWQLARALGEHARADRYRISLLRGIRSIMQLQFVDDVDMYYVRSSKSVVGGIRTTVYDNRIRCDNVQHPMMAIIKVLRMFEASDYADAN